MYVNKISFMLYFCIDEFGAIAGTGKLKNVDRFDGTFFSAHPKLAEVMDAMTRIFLERSIDAIIDAGLSPLDLNGTNTAVFTGSAISETEMYTLDCSRNAAFSMLGRSRTMQANRVSYILNLIGTWLLFNVLSQINKRINKIFQVLVLQWTVDGFVVQTVWKKQKK